MSDFLTYKKISDLEEVEEVLSGATIPVLDGDGVVKRISAEGIGSGSNGSVGKPVIFIISQSSNGKVLFDRGGAREATAKEVLDAYFANDAYVDTHGGAEFMPQKIIGFYLSGGGHGGAVLYDDGNLRNSAQFGYELTQSEIAALARTYY